MRALAPSAKFEAVGSFVETCLIVDLTRGYRQVLEDNSGEKIAAEKAEAGTAVSRPGLRFRGRSDYIRLKLYWNVPRICCLPLRGIASPLFPRISIHLIPKKYLSVQGGVSVRVGNISQILWSGV